MSRAMSFVSFVTHLSLLAIFISPSMGPISGAFAAALPASGTSDNAHISVTPTLDAACAVEYAHPAGARSVAAFKIYDSCTDTRDVNPEELSPWRRAAEDEDEDLRVRAAYEVETPAFDPGDHARVRR
ncbi:hypothetical protein DENSPDRAFT_145697 [Dentipellis sp. KUC8613]|nr:hypothetical protein DENSPDRAFT_145697 [Dentipellis sp. KUC8613]